MVLMRSGPAALVIALLTVSLTPSLSHAADAPLGTVGIWVDKGSSSTWTTANASFGPLESSRIFYSGSLPASYVGSKGSDLPDDVTLVVSYKTPDTNVASFVCSIPDTRNVVLSYYHESEGPSPFASGADYVAAFSAQVQEIRDAATSCGVTAPKIAQIAMTYQYGDPSRRGYDCSFIPPSSSVDYYLADTYETTQVPLEQDAGFQRWNSCVAGAAPQGLAEYGIALGARTASGCTFTDAQRATVLQADAEYLRTNFPGLVMWAYSWVPDTGSACLSSWQFPIGGQSAATWQSIAAGAPLPPVVSITQPIANATVRGTLTVAGTAGDSAGVTQVQVSVDGGLPQLATGTSPWSLDVDTTTLVDGGHTLAVQVTDANGTIGTATVPVTVKNAPGTSCTVPAAGMTELSGNVSLESALTGWTGPYNGNSSVTRVALTGGSYDGNWALRIAPRATGAAGVNNAKPLWVPGSPGVATIAGHIYTASAFVRANTVGRKVSLRVKEITTSGTAVNSGTVTVTLGDTNWHRISTSYTAKRSGDRLGYTIFGAGFSRTSQQILADCLSLQTAAS